MSDWDGKEKRKASLDHIERDRLLTQIDANLSNFMRRFDDHVKEDKASFADHELQMGKLKEGQEDIRKFIWTATGVVLTVVFVIKLVWR